jgi:hypothetical protein
LDLWRSNPQHFRNSPGECSALPLNIHGAVFLNSTAKSTSRGAGTGVVKVLTAAVSLSQESSQTGLDLLQGFHLS